MSKVNYFILFSTLGRSFIEIYIPFILIKNNYSIRDIMLFYAITYFYNIINLIIISKITSIKIYYLYPIFFMLFSIFLSIINKTFIINSFAIYLYSLYLVTYFTIKNICSIKNNRVKTNMYIIYTIFGIIIGTIIGYFNIFKNRIFIIILSFIFMLISALVLGKKDNIKYNIVHRIRINSIIFLFFEQFKYTIITFSSLYMFLFINSRIKYIVLINILSHLSSIFFLLVKKSKINNYYLDITILFLLYMLKFNNSNNIILIIILFLEGIFRYSVENISIRKIYKECPVNCEVNYSIKVEMIKNIFRFIITCSFFILNVKLYYILIISCMFLFISISIKYDNL